MLDCDFRSDLNHFYLLEFLLNSFTVSRRRNQSQKKNELSLLMAGDDDRASSPVAPREKENSREGSLKVESSDNPSFRWLDDHRPLP